MKAAFGVLSVLILASVTTQCVSGQSLKGESNTKPIAFYNTDSIVQLVRKHVNDSIKKWEKRGVFETTQAYHKRVTPEKAQKLSDKLTQKKLNQVINEMVKLHLTSIDYDPDNETYKLDFFHVKPIYLNVSNNSEAKSFMRNADQLEYHHHDYTIDEDSFALLSVTVKNPANSEYYFYNHKNEYRYNRKKVTSGVDSIKIEVEVDKGGNGTIINPDEDLDPNTNISKSIPRDNSQTHSEDFAVVIGNKQYQETSDVKYADKDATLVRKYLIKVLGFKKENVFFLKNADKNTLTQYFGSKTNHKGKLYNEIQHDESEVFIYYSGHGVPDKNYDQAYLLPTNGNPYMVDLGGYSLKTFYKNLSKLPAESRTIVLDACFSGAGIFKENVSAPPIIVDEQGSFIENMAVITSSSGRQFSTWYNAKEHGLFTWAFLKAIYKYETTDTNDDGKVTIREIFEYISDKNNGVPYYARSLYGEPQNPTLKGDKTGQVLFRY